MKRILFCLVALVTLFLFEYGDSDMAIKFSKVYYSNMVNISAPGEGWTIEENLISLNYVISSNDHSASLVFDISNPENAHEVPYSTYQRIYIEDREHGAFIFVGRVEKVEPNEERQSVRITCRDYSLELAERYVKPNEARHAAFYMLGQRRDQIIDGIVVDYRYSTTGGGPNSIEAPFDGVIAFDQTGDAGITKDYRSGGMTALGAIAELAEEAPWPAPFVGRGYEFFVWYKPHALGGIGQRATFYRRGGTAAGLAAIWGAPDVWTDTVKPMMWFRRNRKGEDVFSRAIVYGMGDVVGASTDAGMEAAWGGAGKQIIKEAYIVDPSIQTVVLAQNRASGYLYANEDGLGGENVVQFAIPGLPYYKAGPVWYLNMPGNLINIQYSPLAISEDVVIKTIEYREPECISIITAERLTKRGIANYIEQAGKRAMISESEHKQYYDSNNNNPGGVWTQTTGANPVIVVHNFGAIPRTVKVYGATNNAGADICEGSGYHSVFTPPAGPTNYYGCRVDSLTATQVVLVLNLTGFAFSSTAGRWILNNGIDFFRVIVEP